MSNHSRPSEPGAWPDETSQSDPSEWPDLTLSQNDSPIDAESVEEEADVVGQETQELQSRSETLGGLLPGGIARYRRRIRPVDGADLLQKAAPFARILAQGMKVSLTPIRRSNGTRGRLDVRRIVAIPDCPDPFATKEIVTFSAAPGSFWGMMLDLSGSKLRRNRWYSTQITAAAFHLACQSLGLAHQVVTSISLEVVAGEEVAPHKAIHLLAGTKPASNWDGDNYRETIPIYLEAVMRRPEAIRGVLVETDGQPGDPEQVKELVDDGRKRGLIIVGCGLDLGDGDARGMREIFGNEFLVLATRDSFPMELASTLTTLTMRYVRAK